MLRLKEGPNQPGPIFPTLFIYFVQFFSLIKYSLRDPNYIRPRNFYFRDPFRDSHSRPHFATPLATHVRDSRLHPQPRLAVSATSPSCDSTTDGWTVLTPQRHLPSVPTLTLIKNFGTFSLAWPPTLATAHHHVHHP